MENNSRNNGAVKKQQVINYGFGVQNIYTEEQWRNRELHYTEALVNLVVPTQQELNTIATFNATLDQIQTEALLEIALIERQYEKFNNLIKKKWLLGMAVRLIRTKGSQSNAATAYD